MYLSKHSNSNFQENIRGWPKLGKENAKKFYLMIENKIFPIFSTLYMIIRYTVTLLERSYGK